MKFKLIIIIIFIGITHNCNSQCSNIYPDKNKIQEYGDPTSIGIFGTMHRGLKIAIETRGCPVASPIPIVEYIALNRENAMRQKYSFEDDVKVKSIIVTVKGWKYIFNNNQLNEFRIFTGKGSAKGTVYKVSHLKVTELVKTKINGIQVKANFGQW